jgi:hypothetical protein
LTSDWVCRSGLLQLDPPEVAPPLVEPPSEGVPEVESLQVFQVVTTQSLVDPGPLPLPEVVPPLVEPPSEGVPEVESLQVFQVVMTQSLVDAEPESEPLPLPEVVPSLVVVLVLDVVAPPPLPSLVLFASVTSETLCPCPASIGAILDSESQC